MSAAGKSLLTGSLALLFFSGWFVTLRPTVLGGPATYIIVSGTSMEPTYFDGDLVVVGERDQFAVGDVIAYRVDDYHVQGQFVIHRIMDGNEADGFITQGDNRQEVDSWSPTSSEIVGAAFVRVPRLGRLFAFLRQNPWYLAAILGTFMVLPTLQFRVRKDRRRRRQVVRERRERRRRSSLSIHLKL